MTRLLLAALVAALVAVAGLWISAPSGITFRVTNVGPDPLRNVVVHVTGRRYAIGDLAPGAVKSVALRPGGESHVELSSAGNPRLKIDCYFEPSYTGRIWADITPTKVVAVQEAVYISSLFQLQDGSWWP